MMELGSCTSWSMGNSDQMLEKHFFRGGKILEHVAQSDCGASVPGDWAVHSLKQPHLIRLALSRGFDF